MFGSDTPLVRNVFIICQNLTLDWFWSRVMLNCFHLNPGMGSQFGLFVFRMAHSSEMLRNTPNVWYGLTQASIDVVRQASIFVVRQLVWSARQAVCRCLACHLWDDIVTPPFFCLCYRLHLHSSTMWLPIESTSFSPSESCLLVTGPTLFRCRAGQSLFLWICYGVFFAIGQSFSQWRAAHDCWSGVTQSSVCPHPLSLVKVVWLSANGMVRTTSAVGGVQQLPLLVLNQSLCTLTRPGKRVVYWLMLLPGLREKDTMHTHLRWAVERMHACEYIYRYACLHEVMELQYVILQTLKLPVFASSWNLCPLSLSLM